MVVRNAQYLGHDRDRDAHAADFPQRLSQRFARAGTGPRCSTVRISFGVCGSLHRRSSREAVVTGGGHPSSGADHQSPRGRNRCRSRRLGWLGQQKDRSELDGHGGLVPDRPQPRIDDPGQGSPLVPRLETRPEQAESSDPHATNLAAPANQLRWATSRRVRPRRG